MKNKYIELRTKQQARVNEFPMKFAFSDEQFEKAMKELGLTKDDTDKVVSINLGGFIRKEDVEAYNKMGSDIEAELKNAIKADTTGEGFIADMFEYELNNHEYGYTGDSEPAINALGMTYKQVQSDKALSNGFAIAKKKIWEWEETHK